MLLLCNKIILKCLFQAIEVLCWGWAELEEVFGFVPIMFKENSKQSQ